MNEKAPRYRSNYTSKVNNGPFRHNPQSMEHSMGEKPTCGTINDSHGCSSTPYFGTVGTLEWLVLLLERTGRGWNRSHTRYYYFWNGWYVPNKTAASNYSAYQTFAATCEKQNISVHEAVLGMVDNPFWDMFSTGIGPPIFKNICVTA